VARQLAQGRPPDQVNVPSDPTVGGVPTIEVLGPDGRVFDLDRRQVLPGLLPAPLPSDQAVRMQRQIATQQGQITLVAERSLGDVNRTVRSVTGALLLGVPMLVAATAALAWYLTGRALRPVEAIRAEAAAITGTTMHRRVPEPDSGDEVGRLARTMNAMLTQLEVALRRGERADWPQVARRVLDEDQRLESAVGELLDLARVDEGASPAPVDVDLDDLVLEEAGRVRPVPVDTSRVSAGRVEGDPRLLARLVRNLIDNASSHARSRVAVAVATHGEWTRGWVALVVDDDGPGIPPSDRERIFDRFTRLDEGRDREGGGAGLGLAMVQAIAERHGGTVTIDDAPIGGARFVVRLPRGRVGP
jgi:signal transduction histidine kinase